MTQADSAIALRMSLDSNPMPGQGQAASTPLPAGWGSFCSNGDEDVAGRWYAVSPFPVEHLRRTYGRKAFVLDSTVWAPTWAELREAVQAQAELYVDLLAEIGE